MFSIDLGLGCPCSHVDPVCRMHLSDDSITSTVSHEGFRYRFCSSACAQRFKVQPDRFLHTAACSGDVPSFGPLSGIHAGRSQ
ncbi:YHS domain-containing protein [Mycobacterium neglectum]|uniref:YHS domain-containing protein n=1 Tax=Mycobacterium neglectum TaxID=242737 RepID=UPI003CCBF6A3